MTAELGLLRRAVAEALAGADHGAAALDRARERDRVLDGWLAEHGHVPGMERFARAETMRAHPALPEYVSAELRRYSVQAGGAPVLPMTRRLSGTELAVPAVALPATTVDLLPLRDQAVERHPGWDGAPHVRLQRTLGRTIADRLCYRAASLRVGPGTVTIEGGLTTYGAALAAQDGLEWELLDQAAGWMLAEG